MVAATAAATAAAGPEKLLRVAVVGGGIAGTLASLVLRNRGIASTVISSSSGAAAPEFIRTTTDQAAHLGAVLQQLEQRQLVAKWQQPAASLASSQQQHDSSNNYCRWGMLGATKGGYLPADIVAATVQRNQRDDETVAITPALDAGDFCGFVNSYRSSNLETYVAAPNLLEGILQAVQVPIIKNQQVEAVEMVPSGGWRLQTTTPSQVLLDNNVSSNNTNNLVYDGLVLATGEPSSLCSRTVRSIAELEQQAAAAAANPQQDGDATTSQSLISSRLFQLAAGLQSIADCGAMPLYKVSVELKFANHDAAADLQSLLLPFDAVSVHGSTILQYLVRESSKPSFMIGAGDDTTITSRNSNNDNVWTAISTSSLAANNNNNEEQLRQTVLEEMHRLLQLALDNNSTNKNENNDANSTRSRIELLPANQWVVTQQELIANSSIFANSLQLKEDCIMLEPWRLALAGSYLADRRRHNSSPWEAAAVSGLQAGERMAAALLSGSK